MGTGSWLKSKIQCPYYKDDNAKFKQITCEGILPGSSVRTTFVSRDDYQTQLEQFCLRETYWSCEICEAIDKKYDD